MPKLKVKDIPVGQIYLDPDNPRHDPISNELEIIAHLVGSEQVRPLARSIAELGSTSPIELMAVVPHPTAKRGYMTAEGNRRLCALKLLADPNKAPEKDRKYFRSLRETMDEPIGSVPAVVFDSMDSTRPWVALRHNGFQDGIGLKGWEARASTRFALSGAAKTPNAQALLLVEYARRKGLLPSDAIDRLNLTTLTRYLATPAVRFALGLVEAKTLQISVPVDEFDRAIGKFLADSVPKPSAGRGKAKAAPVHSRAGAEERATYAQGLHAAGVAPVTRGLEPYTPDPGADAQPQSSPRADSGRSAPATPGRRNKQDRDKARYVVPSGFAAPIDDPVFQRLFLELRTLDAQQYSFAATYLLRAVIEQAAMLFLRAHGIAPPDKLHNKLQKVLAKLESQHYTGSGLPALRKMSSDVDSRYSPDTIGMFIHGGAVPTKVNAIRAWDTFQPIMVEIVRQLT